jgi:hypothetical protein
MLRSNRFGWATVFAFIIARALRAPLRWFMALSYVEYRCLLLRYLKLCKKSRRSALALYSCHHRLHGALLPTIISRCHVFDFRQDSTPVRGETFWGRLPGGEVGQ